MKDITAGKSWEDVARTVSTDASTGPQAGDLGWLQANDTRSDEEWLKAVFAAPVNTPTAVIEGTDGVYRIGRVTEIAPSSVDPAYQTKFENKGIDLAKYRAVLQGDVIHDKLQGKIVADVTGSGPQRKVEEIYIHEAAADLPADSDQGPPHPVRAQGRSGERLDRPGQRSLVGSRPVAGARDVRPAQGRSEPVRRHRPQGEPGDAGAGPERQRRQAALLRQQQLRSTRSS